MGGEMEGTTLNSDVGQESRDEILGIKRTKNCNESENEQGETGQAWGSLGKKNSYAKYDRLEAQSYAD